MSLEHLPAEVLLEILSRLPDLDTLHHLLRASPVAHRLFADHGLAVIEDVLSDPLVASQVRQLVRAVLWARSSAPFPFPSLDHLTRELLLPNLPRHAGFPERPRAELPRLPQCADGTRARPSSFAPRVLRSVVATAHRVSALARACLDAHLARLRDPATFAPRHYLGPGLAYTHDYLFASTDDAWVPAWRREFPGATPVRVTDVGPPAWVEENRVRRALWLVQLRADLRRRADRGDLGWPAEDVNRFRALADAADLAGLLGPPILALEATEEVRTVVAYLEELTGQTGRSASEDPHRRDLPAPPPPPTTTASDWTTQTPPALIATWAGEPYVYDYGDRVVKCAPSPEARARARFPRPSEAQSWGLVRGSLSLVSPGTAFFRSLTAPGLDAPAHAIDTPLCGAPFDPFRRLGLALWSAQRLHHLGLLDGIKGPRRGPAFYYFAWRSLLSAEEVARVQAALDERLREERERERRMA